MIHISFRRLVLLGLLLLGGGAALFATSGTSETSAATSAAAGELPIVAGAPAPTICNGPTVHDDRTVTFCLTAPDAGEVVLGVQTMFEKAPTNIPYPMTKGADGIWSVTLGPVEPNYYGYSFNVAGVQLPDPANRTVSFFQVPPVWPGPSSPSSWVLVPGPESDYMAETDGPHGAVSQVFYHSDVLDAQQQMLVYTPPGYSQNGNRIYPVLYLYPGGGGANTDWPVNMRANFILDNLIAAKKMKPMIVVMPEYNLRECADFTNERFSDQLLKDVVPAAEKAFRIARGSSNRALAGLSSGGGCVSDTLFKKPGAFGYYGEFSPNWTATAREDLTTNHQDVLHDPAVRRNLKLLWITTGGAADTGAQIPSHIEILEAAGIPYRFVKGPTYGANYGHVWDTWRKALLNFAPQLFHRHRRSSANP